MNAFICERGIALSVNKFIELFGNDRLLKLKNHLTISTIDKITKIPKKTAIFNIVKTKNGNILEVPKFCLDMLKAKKYVETVTTDLSIGDCMEHVYTGVSNPNQQVVVKYVFNLFEKNVNGYEGATLKLMAGCHAKDAKILMFGGTIKLVQDIKVGDLLMGDDSTSRTVLSLVNGVDYMYQISDSTNDSYVVNLDHILCLTYTDKKQISFDKGINLYRVTWFEDIKSYRRSEFFETLELAQQYFNNLLEDLIVEISVRDYLQLSNSLKLKLKGYKVSVDYPEILLPIDPYHVGYWLTFNHEKSRETVSLQNKHIPYMYKCNSRENRLKLLAGLLDADGYLNQSSETQFNFGRTFKNTLFVDDVIDLCRSLGLSCNRTDDIAWRLVIKGAGLEHIPTLNHHLKINTKPSIEDNLIFAITVIKLEPNEYFGFQLDGNKRYLMSNFIVTHNCGKSYVAMDLISKIKRKTLIVVPNTYLLNQWVKLLTDHFPTATIGELYGKRKVDGDIIVGIINTISDLTKFEVKKNLPLPNIGKTVKYIKHYTTVDIDHIFAKIGLTIFDESQMYVSKEFRKAFKRVCSRFTIGLSATPDIREDKLDRIHTAWLGSIIDADELENYSPTQDAFQSKATLIKYYGHSDHVGFKIRDDGMMEYQSIIESLVNDPNRNKLLVIEILKLAKNGYYVFVFSDRRSHLEHLYDTILKKYSSDSNMCLEMPEANKKIILYGGSSDDTIQAANDVSNIVFTTYQYSSTGVSIKKMDCLVLTTPRRSNMKQIINRVFRLGSDQSVQRQIIDIIDMKMPIKNQHRERIKAYKERGSEIVFTEHIV